MSKRRRATRHPQQQSDRFKQRRAQMAPRFAANSVRLAKQLSAMTSSAGSSSRELWGDEKRFATCASASISAEKPMKGHHFHSDGWTNWIAPCQHVAPPGPVVGLVSDGEALEAPRVRMSVTSGEEGDRTAGQMCKQSLNSTPLHWCAAEWDWRAKNRDE